MTSLSSEVSQSAEIVVHRLLSDFKDQFGSADGALVARAPGRVNLIGDHTDYNDGFVLPITIDHDVYAVVRARADDGVRLYSVNYEDAVFYPLEDRPHVTRGSWASYVTGAIEELRRRGFVSGGFDMMIYGNVPLGAGLSSSAALEVAVVFGLSAALEFDIDPIDAIRLCQTVEHWYAGVQCGIMDQFASRLGRRGHALFLDCRTLDHEHVPLPLFQSGLALVIADSRVTRELANSKYSERRDECDAIVAVANQSDGDVMALRDLTPAVLGRLGDALTETLRNRARHVIEENQRVKSARDALKASDFEAFGTLMNESHESLRDLYEVSAPELDLLVATAQNISGVHGARMTGGGFGGCTVNLVEQAAVSELKQTLRNSYADEYGREPRVYVLKQNHQTELLYADE